MEGLVLGELVYSSDPSSERTVKVYKAHLGARTVAVKKQSHESIKSLNSALTEALAQAKFSGSPTVCEVIGVTVSVDPLESTLVLEWLDHDLQQEIETRAMERRHWSEAELFHYLYSLTEVLEAMQRRGICHRDLKPQNLFLSGDQVKLGDFSESKTDVINGHAKTITGTLGYLSPELRRYFERALVGPVQADYNPFKSDVYSLGATLLHMSLLRHAVNVQQALALVPHNLLRPLLEKMVEENPRDRPDFIDLFADLKLTKMDADRQQTPCLHCKERTYSKAPVVVLECSHLHYFHSRQCLEDFLLQVTQCYSRSVPLVCPECMARIREELLWATFGGQEGYGNFIEDGKRRCVGCLSRGQQKLNCSHVFCAKCLCDVSFPDHIKCPLCRAVTLFPCDKCCELKATELACGHFVCGKCAKRSFGKFFCEFDNKSAKLL